MSYWRFASIAVPALVIFALMPRLVPRPPAQGLRAARAARIALISAIGLLAACNENEAPDDDPAAIDAPRVAEIVPAGEALSGAHIPTLDPAPMNDAEVRRVLGAGPRCTFRYAGDGKPVLAVKWKENDSEAEGVVKLNGNLVALSGSSTGNRLMLNAEDIRLLLTSGGPLSVEPRREEDLKIADLTFEVRNELKVGYSGYYACSSG